MHDQPVTHSLTPVWIAAFFTAASLCPALRADAPAGAERFRAQVQPILENYCYGCHGYGASEGGRTLDEFASDEALVGNVDLWHAVLKNVRAGLMPPAGEERPTDAERAQLFRWIHADPFGVDPAEPDPGRVTLRRLNRVEYRNTIRDLMDVDYNTDEKFPADDSGYGFDNVGDALSMSTLLMEKYMSAAEAIVADAMANNHHRFFPDGPPPDAGPARDEHAHDLLRDFATKAFRRPVEEASVDRLAALAKTVYDRPGKSFEQGISQSMIAVLASPRFLFRVEDSAAASAGEAYPLIDQYALASRLSYFLWSTMPDQQLLDVAARGELRANFAAQVERMLADRRSQAFVENFAGQWLQARDVETIAINAVAALGRQKEWEALLEKSEALRRRRRAERRREEAERRDKAAEQSNGADADADQDRKQQEAERKKARQAAEAERQQVVAQFEKFKALRDTFSDDVRRAMRRETEMSFEYVLREDRSVLELLDSDYTFLNAKLAEYYSIEGVEGDEMRRVELPPDSPRGGLLTQGTLLVVTSNPTRTSPVKRGLYILDNILGTPAPPPPAAVPPLEASADSITDHEASLREALDLHRKEPICAGCHARMDPLGLALENFNAIGLWRDTEHGRPIDTSGTLLTGESFNTIGELKKVLKNDHRLDFYRCLTEKMLTYALGRGLEYYDEHTVDQIVRRLDEQNGRFSVLLTGIVESAQFQRHRAIEVSK